ncbi:beta-1 3-galactosyltransferase 5 [Biomphalaria glabrata]|nr:beta-1; 3-galactosyltransferase 5-like [Biomphalaria glabrata]
MPPNARASPIPIHQSAKERIGQLRNDPTNQNGVNLSIMSISDFQITPQQTHNTSIVKISNNVKETSNIKETSNSFFTNFTRLKHENLFQVIQDDHLSEADWSNYEDNFRVKNDLNDEFLLTGEDICLKDVPYLLIIIPSVISEVDRRDLLRKTWLKAAETNSWPRAEIKDKIKHIFLFGSHYKVAREELQNLTKEAILNNDIVMANFEDTYGNLTVKILAGLKWTLKYCAKVTFVLQCDMDTLINVPLMINFLHYVQNNRPSDKFVIGLKHISDKPPVVRSENRWKVTNTEYPLPFYPRYFYGHTYALSNGSLDVLIAMSTRTPLIAPEDAYITGILSKIAGVLRLHAPCFTVCCRKIFDCEIVWNTNVAITEINNNDRLERLWSNIVWNRCNKSKPISEEK